MARRSNIVSNGYYVNGVLHINGMPQSWDPNQHVGRDEVAEVMKAVDSINAIRKHLSRNLIIDAGQIYKLAHEGRFHHVDPAYNADAVVDDLDEACETANFECNSENPRSEVLRHAVRIITGDRDLGGIVHQIAIDAFREKSGQREYVYAALREAARDLTAPRTLIRPPVVPTPRNMRYLGQGASTFVHNRGHFNEKNLAINAISKASRAGVGGAWRTVRNQFRQAGNQLPRHTDEQLRIRDEAAGIIGDAFASDAIKPFPQTAKMQARRERKLPEGVPRSMSHGNDRGSSRPLQTSGQSEPIPAGRQISTAEMREACDSITGMVAVPWRALEVVDQIAARLAADDMAGALFAARPLADVIATTDEEILGDAGTIRRTVEEIADAAVRQQGPGSEHWDTLTQWVGFLAQDRNAASPTIVRLHESISGEHAVRPDSGAVRSGALLSA